VIAVDRCIIYYRRVREMYRNRTQIERWK